MIRREMICNRPLAHGRPMEHHNITAQLNSEENNFLFSRDTQNSQMLLHLPRSHTAAEHPQTCLRTPQSASLRMHLHPYARHAHRTPPRYNPQRPQAKHARTSPPADAQHAGPCHERRRAIAWAVRRGGSCLIQ